MKVALAYSHTAKKSSQAAKHVIQEWGADSLNVLDADGLNGKDLAGYDLIIAGVPTWFDGELPNYWDEMVPELEEVDFSKSKVAVFGLGNQKEYPENFCDGVGLLADVFTTNGASIVGYTSTEGYSFESSSAHKNDQFCGLALDFETQPSLTKDRISNWVKQLKAEVK